MPRQISKTIRLGTAKTYNGRSYSIFCKIEYDGTRLSISGVEGPLPSGNCLGGCGQIIITLKLSDLTTLAPGWTYNKVQRFFDVWNDWHLNDMTAGSPRQEAFLKQNPVSFEYPDSHFDMATRALQAAELSPDEEYIHNGEPYEYGHAWLKTEVPEDVMLFLTTLPSTDKQPAWV